MSQGADKPNAIFTTTKNKIATTLNCFYLGKTIYAALKELYSWYLNTHRLILTIKSDNILYEDLVEWVGKQNHTNSARSWVVSFTEKAASSHDEIKSESESSYVPSTGLKLLYNGEQSQKINITDQYRVKARLVRPIMTQSSQSNKSDFLEFSTTNEAAHKALLEYLESLYAQKLKTFKVPTLYVASKYGHFYKYVQGFSRSIDSVILKNGQIDRLVNDMKLFLSEELSYANFGLPYHRGYLLYGPPGTGKTSVATALASHLQLDVYVVSLADMESDVSFSELLHHVKPKSVLLLEDVDVFHAATEREETSGLTLSGLLNALDGVSTPYGMITIMTTNHVDSLDPALIRRGRIDISEELTVLDNNQGRCLYEYAYGETAPRSLQLSGITPAEVIEVVKQNMHDSKAALKALKLLTKVKA